MQSVDHLNHQHHNDCADVSVNIDNQREQSGGDLQAGVGHSNRKARVSELQSKLDLAALGSVFDVAVVKLKCLARKVLQR